MGNNSKKQLLTFLSVAYGVTIVMWLFMFIGLKSGKELSALVNVQMMYPACGVMLGLLLFGDKEKKLPKAGFIVALISTVVLMAVGVISIFAPQTMIDTASGQITNWNLYSQYIIMGASIIVYVLFWICGKEKRKNSGLSRTSIKLSILLALLFIALYMARIYITVALSQLAEGNSLNTINEINNSVFNTSSLSSMLILLINFPFSFIIFFGEEYGWRYYLQSVLQKKFGQRLGVLILGIVWGAWHLGIDFMFYTTTTGPVYFLSQVITCIALGIFFGYAYMKTQNIWLVTMMHYLNNNLIVLLSGGDVNVLQNQTATLAQLPVQLISCLVFIAFILAPVYNKKKSDQDSSTYVA